MQPHEELSPPHHAAGKVFGVLSRVYFTIVKYDEVLIIYILNV